MKIFKLRGLLIVALSAFVVSTHAASWHDGATGEPVQSENFFQRLEPGQVVVLSELHGFTPHHDNQRAVLAKIIERGLYLNVGMEHFEYTSQPAVNDYLSGKILEEDFLKLITWGGLDFGHYRPQVLMPTAYGGTTLALNLPRSVSGKIARQGLESLTADEAALLPPQFTPGPATYYERFSETMKDHVPDEKIMNYFVAHSSWDDTMAWQAAEFMRSHPTAVLAIIVGDFHVAYQDGLVARLRARGVSKVLTLSQVNTAEMTDDERKDFLKPHASYGPRADFIFDVR